MKFNNILNFRHAFWQLGVRLLMVLGLVNGLFFVAQLDQYERILNFKVRTLFDKEPPIHPKLKVFAIDDTMVSELGSNQLLLEEWAKVLKNIADYKPAAIVISQMFIQVMSDNPESRQVAIEALEAIDVPIITGSYFSRSVKFRAPLPMAEDVYNLQQYLLNEDGALWYENPIKEDIPKQPDSKMLYGSQADLQNIFKHYGHMMFISDSSTTALMRHGTDKVLPHFTLLIGKQLQFKGAQFYIDDQFVPLNKKMGINLNLIRFRSMLKKTNRLLLFYNEASPARRSAAVTEGDIVYIMPQFYTGGTEFKNTPVGPIPLDAINMSILNSILTKEWLRPITFLQNHWWYNVAAAVGFILPMAISVTGAMIVSLLISLMIVGSGIAAFVYGSIELPWINTFLFFVASSMLNALSRAIKVETNSKRMARALSGLLPANQVEAVIRDPAILDLKPTKKEVSIMFVDIVGFSLSSEKMASEDVFNEIKDYLVEIGDIVLKYDGVIDKTLGDGMVCFFGYDIGNPDHEINHALHALECAQTIQQLCYRRNVKAAKVGSSILPLRIGINTAAVIIGNLGGQRIDITMIGEGVNFASRLETSCEPFKIMVGDSTKEKIGEETELLSELIERQIQVKHYENLYQAFELDPFKDNKDKLEKLKTIYWAWADQKIIEDRIDIEFPGFLTMDVNNHCFEVINFSMSGFLIKGPSYLARGVSLNCSLDTADQRLSEELSANNLIPFLIEIKWGITTDDEDQFILGVRMTGLNLKQKKLIFDACCRYNTKEAVSISSF